MSQKSNIQLILAVLSLGVYWVCISLLGEFTPIDLPATLTALLLADWPLRRKMSQKSNIQLVLAVLSFGVYWVCISLLGEEFTPIDLPATLTALLLASWPLLWSALERHFPLTQVVFGKDQQPLEPVEEVGLALYRITLSLELLPTILRFGVYWVCISLLGMLTPMDLPANLMASLLAGWPLLWSALAFRFPGRGGFWHRKAGARRVALQEAERICERMPNPPNHPSERLKLEYYAIEDHLQYEGALGGATILSTGLIWSDYLEAVLDHAGAHIRSLDARLSEALRRLRPFEDPLAPDQNDRNAERDRLPVRLLRWLLVGAGGGFGQWVLDLPWSWYWREREFDADATAVASGNGPGIVAYLKAVKSLLDRPRPRLVAGGRYKHPAAALREERIEAREEGHEITWKTELCLSSNFFVRLFVRLAKMSDPYAEAYFAH